MITHMKIDLCIVNYNTTSCIVRLLDTLIDRATLDDDLYTVYIQDNSVDDMHRQFFLDEVVHQLYSRWGLTLGVDVHVEFNPSNPGYSQACNHLAHMGSSKYIAMLNSDTWFTADDIRLIIQRFESDSSIGVIGPKQRNESGYITHAGIFGTNDSPKHRGWHEHDVDDSKYRDVLDAITVSGSAYFMSRKVFDETVNHPGYRELATSIIENSSMSDTYPVADIGAFLPTRHYYEETWCSYFVRHLGYRVIYDGTVSIGHSWHASHRRGSAQDKMFAESRHLFRRACDFYGITHD